MGKSRGNRRKRKPLRRSSPFSNLNISRIDEHAKQGGKLTPPLAQLPNANMSSWMDDHMPEMLWAVLLTGTFERPEHLGCFRELAPLCAEWFRAEEEVAGESRGQTGAERMPNLVLMADHTKLSQVSDEQFRAFLAVPLRHPLGYAALRPLLLIESLPGRDRWHRVLGVEPTADDWSSLARAVAGVLDHQSEQSTDIRWFKLIVPAIAGRLQFVEAMRERVEELRLFPNRGDMRSVRPFIRAGEMTFRRNPPSLWIEQFWTEALSKTRCLDSTQAHEYSVVATTLDSKSINAARESVINRFSQSRTARRVDARLDSSFGLVLYALSIAEEIEFHDIHTRIVGRVALRALVEANITLRYLVQKNSDELWRSYRVYGAGQAKLAFLKAQEAEGELPPFLDETMLHEIANEDRWQEYLDIDLGHWANSNLRKLAIDCGAKDVYDRYYDWASGYIHGHWGAVRDTNFLTCHNPLHRLHRIPRLAHRGLNTVEADVVDLVNEMIIRLDQLYPGEELLPKIALLPRDNASYPGGA